MALLNVGDDPWILEYESCEKLCRDIMEQLTLRQRYPRTSDKFSQLSATIRLRLKQYNNEVNQLNQKLDYASKDELITAAESERRKRQIEILQSKGLQMQSSFDDGITSWNRDRDSLINAGSTSFSNDVKDNTRQMGIHELRGDHQRMLGEQDAGLQNLSQIIARQKNIAHTISNEVDLHNEILDDLDTHIDHTNTRVRNETQHVTVVDRKDKTCVYWIVIILLFISIVVVSTI